MVRPKNSVDIFCLERYVFSKVHAPEPINVFSLMILGVSDMFHFSLNHLMLLSRKQIIQHISNNYSSVL